MSRDSDQFDFEKFLAELLNGNRGHYEALKSVVESYVRRQGSGVGGPELVSDIVGAVYSNLKEGKFRGQSSSSFYAYVFAICSNTLKNDWKRGKKLKYVNDTPEPVLDRPSTLSAKYARKELSQLILDQLDEKCKAMLELKFKQNWSDQEVADHFGKSKNAISTAISRCIKRAQNLDVVKELL